MAKGFFREQYHYTVDEISQRLETTVEEARHLLGILKKYGIVKAVKAPKPGYEELPGQDMVLADVLENNPNVEYAFGFVGVVMLEGHVFKCYPKYIFSTEAPMLQLKKVLKVIKKYNEKEQLVYLYNGEDNGRIFNRLAVSLYLLEEYFLYGVYTNSHEIVETNGIGEILWDKTINETVALIRDNRPYYVQMQTRSMEDNDADYFRRLHECVLSQCSTELEAAGILELFDIGQVNLTSLEIGDFGDTDDVKYRLEREMRIQFVTRKQMLLKTLYTYISNEKMSMESSGLSLYGTGNFEQVWEKVCADNFGNMLHEKLGSLPLGVCSEYAGKREKELISMIDRPVWHKNHPAMSGGKTRTLRPDLIRIFPCGGQDGYCFGIYDAKYYCIDFNGKPPCGRVTGQPGVEDITKQYLYQLAYDDFVQKQGYRYVQNAFLCPQEDAEPDYGYVKMAMLQTVGNKMLENIMIVKLCAEEMYDLYLANERIGNITDYIPDVGRKPVKRRNFTQRMLAYLQGEAKRGWSEDRTADTEAGRVIYPERISREVGAKLIYDIMCLTATDTLYEFVPYGIICSDAAEDRGNSYIRCDQMAMAALETEGRVKELAKRQLGNKDLIAEILREAFRDKKEIAVLIDGDKWDMLIENVFGFIKEAYR